MRGKSGWTKNKTGSKTWSLPQRLGSLLSSPRPSEHLPAPSASSPRSSPALLRISLFLSGGHGFSFWSLAERRVSFLSSGGQMKSQLHLTTGKRGPIFSTYLHTTDCTNHFVKKNNKKKAFSGINFPLNLVFNGSFRKC